MFVGARTPARSGQAYRSGALRITVDGNSIPAGAIFSPAQPIAGMLLADRNFIGCSVVDCAIGGQTWLMMNGTENTGLGYGTGSASDVNAAIAATGYRHILVEMETTNSIGRAGRTAVECQGDIATYNAARKLANPSLYIIAVTAPPRYNADSTIGARIMAVNAYMRNSANWTALGVNAVVDINTIPGFDNDGALSSYFDNNPQYWATPMDYIHPSLERTYRIRDAISQAIMAVPTSAVPLI